MTSVVDEVREILGGRRGNGAPEVTQEGEAPNPVAEAVELLRTHRDLITSIQRKLDALSVSLGEAHTRVTRDPAIGLEALGDRPVAALRELRELIDSSLTHVEQVVRSGKLAPKLAEQRLRAIDAALGSLCEGVDTNTAQNNYAAQLAASSAEAARFISSMKQLEVGANVGVGRNAYQVVNTPTKRGAEWFVALSGPGVGKADGYSLLVPETLSKTNPPMGHIKPTREAVLRHDGTGAEVELLFADIKLEGVDASQYGDFGPGIGRIKPGDMVRLTKQVFRVIGKSASAALIQPEKLAREVYGDYGPAMGRIKSPNDFAGRGGTEFRDTSTGEPQPTQSQGQDGHRSLVGTTVLNYNPHTGQYTFPSGKMPGEYEMADTIQIVGHEPDEEHAVGESITIERFEMLMNEAEGDSTMEKLAAVVEQDEPMKVNGVYMDPQTARVILSVQEALGEENQERMSGLSVSTMATIAWKVVNQGQRENAA